MVAPLIERGPLVAEDDGTGSTVLLLHGFTGSARTWDRLAPVLRRRHRVVVPDLLGHGRSAPPTDPAEYDLARQVEVLAPLLARLPSPAGVVGYSMGARIGLRLALDRPDLVSRLALESPSAGIADADARGERRRTDERLARILDSDGIEAFVDTWERQPMFASESALPHADRVRLRRERTVHDPRALAAALRGGGQGAMEPLHGRLGALTIPLLVIVGADDPTGRGRAEALAALIGGTSLAIVEGAGHAPHRERPDTFAELLTSFLDPDQQPD